MAVFEDCGVPIYFAYPQYFDVDATFEKLRIDSTEQFYQNIVRHKREGRIHQCDISKLRPKPMDFSYFGTLADELTELINDSDLDKSCLTDSCHETHQQSDNTDNNIEQVTTQLQMMEFADKLKKDCLLAQDIMNDLEKLCNTNATDKLKKELGIDPSEGFWSLNEGSGSKSSAIQNFDMYFNQPKEYCSTSIPDEKSDDEEVLISGHCSNASMVNDLVDLNYEEDYFNFPTATAHYEGCELVDENQVYLMSSETESVSNKDSNKKTNPFLEDILDSPSETSSFGKDLILNPNNPFLTFRPNKESDESSSSTVYGRIVQEIKLPSWSTEDSRSVEDNNFETVSSQSSSAGSSYIGHSIISTCATATQTVVEEIQNDTESLEMGESCSNSGQQTTPTNYQQNWMAGNFYEYRSGFPIQTSMYNQYNGFGYPVYPGSVHTFRPQYPISHYPAAGYMPGYSSHAPQPHLPSQSVPATSVRPPPGFAPNSNIYQVSRVLQTTVSSNVITDRNGGNDFYDLYNARLRFAMESANNGTL